MIPAAIATMHGKQRQFAPALAAVGVDLATAVVDTDALGTFTGTVARRGGAMAAARAKARLAVRTCGTRAGLGSEGSYGPDPQVPLLPRGAELAVWIDQELGIEVVERHVCSATWWQHVIVSEPDDERLDRMLELIGFPDQAVVVVPPAPSLPITGVRDRVRLDGLVAASIRAGPVRVETDLRAHRSPQRREVLRALARSLADRLAATCSRCGSPGWGERRTEPGLTCASCGRPTRLVARVHLGCVRCDHLETHTVAEPADPMWCGWCNP